MGAFSFCQLLALIICVSLLFNLIHCDDDVNPPQWEKALTALPITLSKFVAGFYRNNIYLLGGVIDEFGRTRNTNIYQLNLSNADSADLMHSDLTSQWTQFDVFSTIKEICCYNTEHKEALTIYSQGSSYTDSLLFMVPYFTDHSSTYTSLAPVLLIFNMEKRSFRKHDSYQHKLLVPLGDPCVVSDAQYVYLIGGVYYKPINTVRWEDTFQIYDFLNDAWTQAASLNVGRKAAGCAILGNYIYLFGGRGIAGDLDSIERFNLGKPEDGWKLISDATLPKHDDELRSIVDTDTELIYLFGGKSNTSQVQVFDRNNLNVNMFYMVNASNQDLQQNLNFVPLLFSNADDSTDRRVLLMGGETDRFVPRSSVYGAMLSELYAYHQHLKFTQPIQALGFFETPTTNTISIHVQTNLISNKVYITMDGPATKWFAVGFNTNRQTDEPYTIFVYGLPGDIANVQVQERKIGARSDGVVLANMLTVEKVEEYTTSIKDRSTVYRTVQISRDRVGVTNDHFTFPSREGELDVIYATGYADYVNGLTYHFSEYGDSALLFLGIPCKANGFECDNIDVDYCCDENAVCDDVVSFDDDGASTTSIRCCISNGDDTTSCALDNECCGDFICVNGVCQEPVCYEDGHACDPTRDCCTHSAAKCDVKWYDNFARQENICCVSSVNADPCVIGGCCGVLQCDPVAFTCRNEMAAPCDADDDCLTGLYCPAGSCVAVPTPQPTLRPTSRPTDAPTTAEPTPRPTPSPSARPSFHPSNSPTSKPTRKPTNRPTDNPSARPTRRPSESPTTTTTTTSTAPTTTTARPTRSPSKLPTKPPSQCIATSDPCLQSNGDSQCCGDHSVCGIQQSGPNNDAAEICCVDDTDNLCIPDGCCGSMICDQDTNRCCVPEGKFSCDDDDDCCENLTCENQICRLLPRTPEPTAPTPKPTRSPTTEKPTPEPTTKPTRSPTREPTDKPTQKPTPSPTDKPTPEPTTRPTPDPREPPHPAPTPAPTDDPSHSPTDRPSRSPSDRPTPSPTVKPIAGGQDDTSEPTPQPTMPTYKRTRSPTDNQNLPDNDPDVIKPLPDNKWRKGIPKDLMQKPCDDSSDNRGRGSSSSWSDSSSSRSRSDSLSSSDYWRRKKSRDFSYPFSDSSDAKKKRRNRGWI